MAKDVRPVLQVPFIATATSLQPCPTLWDRIEGSPLGSSVPGILQARILEWVAISFSTSWMWKVKVKLLSHAQLLATPWTATYQAPLSMGFSRQELLEWVAIAFSVIATRKCLITMCHKESNKGSQLCNETGVCLSSFMKFTVKWPDLGLTTATLFFPFLPFNQ